MLNGVPAVWIGAHVSRFMPPPGRGGSGEACRCLTVSPQYGSGHMFHALCGIKLSRDAVPDPACILCHPTLGKTLFITS